MDLVIWMLGTGRTTAPKLRRLRPAYLLRWVREIAALQQTGPAYPALHRVYILSQLTRPTHASPASGASSGEEKESVWDYPRPPHRTTCEWKGRAAYYTIDVGAERAAWAYPDPAPRYRALKDYLSFYPSKMNACYVGHEPARAQTGDFYGGWITDAIGGPFKGAPDTLGW